MVGIEGEVEQAGLNLQQGQSLFLSGFRGYGNPVFPEDSRFLGAQDKGEGLWGTFFLEKRVPCKQITSASLRY